jgi:hypothetical protein
VWTEDEAGPYQTAPYAGESWHPAGQPLRLPHEYLRNGTAKLLEPPTHALCVGRAERRWRERLRRHGLGGSGAYTRRSVRWRTPRANQGQQL